MSSMNSAPVPRSAPDGSSAPSPAPRGRRRVGLVAGIAVTAAAAVVATGVGVAAASTSPDERTSESSMFSPELREDLQGLHDVELSQRVETAQAILDRAIAGEYGERVAAVADDIDARIDALPDDLEADLYELVETPAEERRELGQQIRERVENGEYGPEAQQQLEEFGDLRPGFGGGMRPGIGSPFTANS